MTPALKTARVISAGNELSFGHALCEGTVCILLEVDGTTENPAPKKGETLISVLRQEILKTPPQNLSEVKALLQLAKDKKHIKTLLLAVFVDKVIYIGLHGEGKGWIKREGKVIPLIQTNGVLSGKTKEDDIFIFQNASALKSLSDEQIKKIIEEHDEEQIEEQLTPLALQPENPGVAILITKHQKEKPEIPQPIPNKNPMPDIKKVKDSVVLFIKEKILQEENFSDSYDPKTKKTKKILITIAVLLLCLFAVSVGFGINSQFGKVKKEEYAKTIELVEHKYDEAIGLTDLNPQRTRSLLKEAKENIKTLLADLPENSIESKTVKEWLNKIENQEIVASRIYKIDNIPNLFDLTIIREGAKGTNMALYEDQLVVLDQEGKRVYTLTTDGKQGKVIAGPDVIKDAKGPAIHGGSAYIVNTNGIIQIDINTNAAKEIIKKDTEWGTIGTISAYGGNLYLLDKSKNQIWKYISTEDGFTERKNYLEEDVQVDLSDGKSMVIDGSIWILNGNDVLKFTQGRLDQYAMIGGIEDELTLDALYTNEDAENIYLLDGKKGRVYLYTKEGKYKETYESPTLKNASDLVVLEKEKKILILNGSKILSVEIK